MSLIRRRGNLIVITPGKKVAICAEAEVAICDATCGTIVVSDDPPGWFQCRDYTPIPFVSKSGSGDICTFNFRTHWPNASNCEDDVVVVELGYTSGTWSMNLYMVYAGDPYDCSANGTEKYNCGGLPLLSSDVSVVGGCLTGTLVFDNGGDTLTLTLS